MWGGLASVVVPRMRAVATVTALVITIVVVATSLVAAVPVYSDAVDASALQVRLDETPPGERGLRIVGRGPAADAGVVARSIGVAVDDAFGFELDRLSFARTGAIQTERELPDDAVLTLAFLADETRHISVVEQMADPPAGAIAVGLHATAAADLGVNVGDTVVVEVRGQEAVLVLAETYRPADRSANVWFGEPVIRDGSVSTGAFVEYAPFLLTAEDLARFDVDVTMEWRGDVGETEVTVATLDDVQAAARGLDTADAVPGVAIDLDVTTGLPDLLAELRDELDAGRAVILTVLTQVVAVALVATAIGGAVAAHSRRREVGLLRMRGASVGQLLGLATLEAVIVVVPGVVVGPVLATLLVRLVDDRGPLRAAGLVLDPEVGVSAWVASLFVGLAAIVLLVAPSAQAAFATRRSTRWPARGDSWMLRNGVDLALAAGAGLLIWRLAGSPAATRGAGGRLGADPLLLLAPGLAILTGSLISLRLIRMAAGLTARVVRSRRTPVAHLAAASTRRRPSATSRVATLVVTAVGVGVFTAMLAASWERSQSDRADAVVVGDAVVDFGSSRDAGSVEPTFRTAAVLGIPGVDVVLPIDVQIGALGSDSVQATVVSTNTTTFDDLETQGSRTDVSGAVATLGARPIDGIALVTDNGGGVSTIDLRLVVDSDRDATVTPTLTLADRFGTLSTHRLAPVRASGAPEDRTLHLESTVVAGAGPAGPIDLVRVEVQVDVPFDPDGSSPDDPPPAPLDVRVLAISVDGVSIDLGSTDFGPLEVDPPARMTRPVEVETIAMASGVGFVVNPGTSETRRATLDVGLRAQRDEIDGDMPLPAIMATPLAAELGIAVGSQVPLRVDGLTGSLDVVAIVDQVPFAVDDPSSVLIDWSTLQHMRFDDTGRVRPPTSVAVTFVGGLSVAERDALADELAGELIGAVSVVEREALARGFADAPVDVALLGALVISGGAAIAIALLGLALNAVVMASDRRTTSAYLRAMGVPRRDVRRWMVVEVAPVVIVSLVVGGVTGAVLAGLGLDGLTLSDDGTPVTPTPIAIFPWPPVLAIVALVGGAALASPLVAIGLLRRTRPAEELRAGAGG